MRTDSEVANCYYCGAPATSVEHVPPRCIFPEMKDSSNVDYRKNLITVPSCDEHNSLKSKDDEYFFLVLMLTFKSNITGKQHLRTKGVRMITRKPSLFSSVDTVGKNIRLNNTTGNLVEQGRLLRIDSVRYERILQHISFALYFHEFRTVFSGTYHMLINGLNYFSPGKEEFDQTLEKATNDFAGFFELTSERADNPEIFTYNFSEMVGKRLFLRMRFHEKNQVIVYFE